MCFSLAWLFNLLIWLIVLCGVVALIQLVINYVLPAIGLAGPVVAVVVRALWIVLWVVVLIALVVFVYDLISCLGPTSMLRVR